MVTSQEQQSCGFYDQSQGSSSIPFVGSYQYFSSYVVYYIYINMIYWYIFCIYIYSISVCMFSLSSILDLWSPSDQRPLLLHGTLGTNLPVRVHMRQQPHTAVHWGESSGCDYCYHWSIYIHLTKRACDPSVQKEAKKERSQTVKHMEYFAFFAFLGQRFNSS